MLKLSTDAYTILAEDQIIYHVIGKFLPIVVNKQHPNYLVIPIEISIGKIIDIMDIGGASCCFHGIITREDGIILWKVAMILREKHLIPKNTSISSRSTCLRR